MPTNSDPQDGGARPPRDPDVFAITLHAPAIASLANTAQELGLDFDHHPPRKEGGASGVDIDASVTQEQIDELTRLGWKVQVGKNLSAVGRERQKEVATGERAMRFASPTARSTTARPCFSSAVSMPANGGAPRSASTSPPISSKRTPATRG